MNGRVLIIEDEIELSGLIKNFLTKRQYDVTCAETLSKAKFLLNSNVFDAVILDNNLPDGKGLDAIPLIQTTQKDPKIIAMSAMQVRDDAIQAGASHYIEKPISVMTIYKLLNAENATK